MYNFSKNIAFVLLFFFNINVVRCDDIFCSVNQKFVVCISNYSNLNKSGLCIKTISLIDLNLRKTIFSKITNVGYTFTAWSPNSKNCLIVYGGDNASAILWFIRLNSTMLSVQEMSLDDLAVAILKEKKDIKREINRTSIDSIDWKDNNTLEVNELYNSYECKISISLNETGHIRNIKVLDIKSQVKK